MLLRHVWVLLFCKDARYDARRTLGIMVWLPYWWAIVWSRLSVPHGWPVVAAKGQNMR